ncbi:MAG: hypothetical protein J1F68_04390 [Clostridiales bacterium]|nr:hypothetical protein [Clostridiales bacterium]
MKQSVVYERAQAMVLHDKFNYRQTEFFSELSKLVARYMDCDGMTVEVGKGAHANMVITISVKKIKPTLPPLA